MLVAGTNEFSRARATLPDAKTLAVLREAYASLKYDLGIASKDEVAAFKEAKVALPAGFQSTGPLGEKNFTINGKHVCFLIFPEIGSAKEAPEQLMATIEATVRKKRAEADLIVGLSPWGYWAEQAYLKASPRHAVDILLGSGPGVEIPGAAMADGRVWWVRAYGRGKYVLRIDVEKWPSKDDHVWSQNGNIRTEPVVLTDGYVEDIDMLSIVVKAEH